MILQLTHAKRNSCAFSPTNRLSVNGSQALQPNFLLADEGAALSVSDDIFRDKHEAVSRVRTQAIDWISLPLLDQKTEKACQSER